MGVLADTMADAATTTTAAANSGSNGLIGGAINAVTGGAINDVMGMIFGGEQDARQVAQQQKLQNIQVQGAEQLADYNQQEQMKTWNETAAPAQVQKLKEAGLNPALMYAGGGGGSGMLGGGVGTEPTGGQAANSADQSNANAGMAMMMMNQKLMQSQVDVNEAQAAKIAGVDTKNVAQNTATQQAQEQLLNSQNIMQNINNVVAGKTIQEAVNTIAAKADKDMADARTAMTTANVTEATQSTQIQQIQQNYINSILQAAAIKSGIQVNNEEIKNLANQIVNRNARTQVSRAAQETNQQNTELQHQDRVTDLSQTMSNWAAWQEIGEKELVIQGIGSILWGAKGAGITSTPGGMGYKPNK